MKWLYLPWKYKSADTATKVLNIFLYVIGALLIISMLLLGHHVLQVRSLGTAEQQAKTHRTMKKVPTIVDHRQYDYIYHTDTRPYNNTTHTIYKVIELANRHDLSSSTDRIYWLQKYVSNDELNDNDNPLVGRHFDTKKSWIGLNTTNDDARNIHFIINVHSMNPDDDTQSTQVIMTGTFDGESQKIINLAEANE